MDVKVGLWRKLSAEELMLLNCGVGEDSLQGDPTSQSKRKSVLGVHWKDWCWNWNSNTLANWCEELTYLKRSWCWENWRREEKGMTEDEMVGWHHWLNGHEFEQALGVGDGQGSLAWCSPWGHKETQLSNWTELNWMVVECRDYTNSYWIIYFKQVNCITCKLYFDKTIFKKL